MLSQNLRQGQAAAERMQLGKIAARLGEWARLLKLVNGFLRDRVAKGQPFARAITGVNKRLNDKGLVAFDGREFSAYPVDVAAWLSAMRPLDRMRAMSRVAESFRWLDQVVPADFDDNSDSRQPVSVGKTIALLAADTLP